MFGFPTPLEVSAVQPKPETGGTIDLSQAPDDDEVVARVRAGDRLLFEVLMRRHNRKVFRAARAILRSDDEAEDVIHSPAIHGDQAPGDLEILSPGEVAIERRALDQGADVREGSPAFRRERLAKEADRSGAGIEQAQEQADRRTALGRRVNRDAAAVPAHDAVNHREAKSIALARLRREERIECARSGTLVHAGAGVADVELDVAAFARQVACERARAVEMNALGLDRQRAALGHRVACVEKQVEHHLMQLAG